MSKSNTEMKVTLKKHPELRIAHSFVNEFEGAVISGGVARDLLNDKDFKDIDIFVPIGSHSEMAKKAILVSKFCDKQNLDLEVTEGYYGSKSVIRIGAGLLDICFVSTSEIDINELLDSFDMVSSQAWLEPIEDGFTVKAIDLFHQLNDKKVLGCYPNKSGSRYYHIERICEKYNDYLRLDLAEQRISTVMEDPDIPF